MSAATPSRTAPPNRSKPEKGEGQGRPGEDLEKQPGFAPPGAVPVWVMTPAALGPEDTPPDSYAGGPHISPPPESRSTPQPLPWGFLPNPASHLGQWTHLDLGHRAPCLVMPFKPPRPHALLSRQCGVPWGFLAWRDPAESCWRLGWVPGGASGPELRSPGFGHRWGGGWGYRQLDYFLQLSCKPKNYLRSSLFEQVSLWQGRWG